MQLIIIICVSISALALYCDFNLTELIEDCIDAVKGQHVYIYVCDGKRYKKRTVRIKNEEIVGRLYRKVEKPLTKLKMKPRIESSHVMKSLNSYLFLFIRNLSCYIQTLNHGRTDTIMQTRVNRTLWNKP